MKKMAEIKDESWARFIVILATLTIITEIIYLIYDISDRFFYNYYFYFATLHVLFHNTDFTDYKFIFYEFLYVCMLLLLGKFLWSGSRLAAGILGIIFFPIGLLLTVESGLAGSWIIFISALLHMIVGVMLFYPDINKLKK